MNIVQKPSGNFNGRKGHAVDMLVIHTTCTKTTRRALDILTDPKSEVSAHYLIDYDGTIYQLVDEKKRAWHAGESFWDGQTDLNARSIGIEIQNTGKEKFPKAQIKALEELCTAIMARHKIPQERIVGHSDIAPHRKKDPGEIFSWEKFARKGFGLWPKERLRDGFNKRALVKDPAKLAGLFRKAGYAVEAKNGRPALEETITAFQRRFEPEAFKKKDGPGKITSRTIRRLKGFIRARGLKP